MSRPAAKLANQVSAVSAVTSTKRIPRTALADHQVSMRSLAMDTRIGGNIHIDRLQQGKEFTVTVELLEIMEAKLKPSRAL